VIHRPLDALVHLAARILGLLVTAAAVTNPAEALPLYASREGRNCISCHFDPNGSAMRNDFGFNYGKNRHSMGEEEKWSNVTVDPQLNDWIRLGMDTRIMYYASHFDGASSISTSTFFPMEGALRVAITPHDYLTVVASHGLVVQSPGFPNSYVARELYGLFHGFAKDLYVQVGRFRLPFGLRQEDHTSFTRMGYVLPYDSQREDAGIEVGAVGNNWFGEVSFTNGGNPFNQQSSTFAAKVGRSSRAFQFGLSGYDETDSSQPDVYRWSLYASATRGPFTVLGEYVANDFKPDESRKAAFTEVVYRVSRGVNLRAKLDYFGPESGTPFLRVVRRYLAEVDINPMPFTDIKVSYRRYNNDDAPDMDEYFAMLFIPF
jgi:elongation factor P hydroxylase